jgi:hypothetical protein
MKQIVVGLLAVPMLIAGLSFAEGTWGYFAGTARLRGVGMPGPEYGNLDAGLRVYRSTSGCIVWGTEPLTHLPNNLAIALLTTLFGPMRGTYHGPYPDRSQVRDALRASRESVDGAAFNQVPQRPVRNCAALAELFPPRADEPTARCAMFEGATLVLGLRDEARLWSGNSGNLYARYRLP